MFRKIIIKLTNLKLNQPTCNLTHMVSANSKEPPQPVEDSELQQQYIEESIKATPELVKVSLETWHSAHKALQNHGLSTFSFLKMVNGNPRILMRSTGKLVDTLEYWRSCQFGEFFLFQLITKYPFLMDIDDERRLLKQISFLQFYVGSSKNVWKLLMNCPTLIEQREETIEAKILYLNEKMRIEIPEIIKSEALAKSLDHIKYRHAFINRLGIYKLRSLKANPDEKSKNPRLYKITDTSEKTFATKVCHVSLAEYEAFKELYTRELERTDDYDLLSDEEN